jgi:hypothetical protein
MGEIGHDPSGNTTSRGVSGGNSYIALLSGVSGGDVTAFRILVDRTAEHVRAALTELQLGRGGQDEILAATYLEVWWLAGCHDQPNTDVVGWIVGIAKRRAAKIATDCGPDSEGTRTRHAQVEFAMLFHHPISGVPGR